MKAKLRTLVFVLEEDVPSDSTALSGSCERREKARLVSVALLIFLLRRLLARIDPGDSTSSLFIFLLIGPISAHLHC